MNEKGRNADVRGQGGEPARACKCGLVSMHRLEARNPIGQFGSCSGHHAIQSMLSTVQLELNRPLSFVPGVGCSCSVLTL